MFFFVYEEIRIIDCLFVIKVINELITVTTINGSSLMKQSLQSWCVTAYICQFLTLPKLMVLSRFCFLPKDPFHMHSKMSAMYLLWHSYDASDCRILCQLDVQYLHPHAAIDSSIDLNPAPQLELSAAIGSKDVSMGAEVGFNTTSASFSKYNAGITFNKPDFSATLML